MHADAERLRRHVATLAATPRPAESAALEAARALVQREFEQCGWKVDAQPFESTTETGLRLKGINLIARHPAHDVDDRPWFCVGAHVDSTPDSPGADDNASAVAALLEIARLLPEDWPAAPSLNLELVAFDLEEYGMLGGSAHVRRLQADGTELAGMVSLEMLGYCDSRPNSQALPRSLVGMYPETGDFIAVIGNQNSGPLIDRFRDGLRRVKELPVETLQVSDNGNQLQATRLSDHSPFWDAGYAALMITDTSFLRNPFYHTPGDTLETLDYEFLRRVAEGCVHAVRDVVSAGLAGG
jgi:Zn-dependent M28 family amino/carboxypeptidase